MHNLELTVEDVLRRDHFKDAKVIAGNRGLKKQVKWTHILETNKFDSLINGGELILTTGAGLQLDSPTGLIYVQNLINRETVGLCIEIGTYVDHIANDVIKLANDYHFPIIIFTNIVKFVDITQDIHSEIINQHHYMINLLNELSAKFNELSLLPNGILKILQKIYTYFSCSAIFITNEAQSYYYPPENKDIAEQICSSLLNNFETNHLNHQQNTLLTITNKEFAIVPVKGLGQTWGYLCLKIKDNVLNKFYYSVMDRAALAIAQIMLRNRTIEERKQNIEDKVVRNLLQGKDYNPDEIQSILPYFVNDLSYRLILIQSNQSRSNHIEEDWSEVKLQQSLMFRSLSKQYGFFPAISVGKSDIAIIAFFTNQHTSSKEKITHLIKAITNIRENNIFDGCHCSFGISKENNRLSNVTESYQEAKKAIFLQNANIDSSIYYEHIGVYRLLLFHQNEEQLTTYIHDCLGPLVNYDDETNSDLLTTLEVYLDCNGSKKEAAEKLFIVRQTLYHRLRKIEELLGKDFMEPAKRLALETAIKGYHLSKAAL